MSSIKPTYFLTPPRPYPPSGPIRLGGIIPSPTLPDEPLHIPSVPESHEISSFNEKNWSGSHVRTSSSRFGIWTSFLQMILSVGGDISVTSKSEINEAWSVDNMCTMSFVPSQAFIEKSVQAEQVRHYIIENRWREKIYMITGVMIASGATTFRESLEERGLFISVGVDATAWTGVPISLGPEAKWKKNEVVGRRSEQQDDFVFAFRVREIRVRRKGGVKSTRAFNKGALFGLHNKLDGDGMIDEEEIEVEGLGEEVHGESFGLEVKEVIQAGVEEGNEGDDALEGAYCVLLEE